jgi:pyrophosphatase PpaX
VKAGGVLFDLDGTLIDTTELILASCRYTFEQHLGACPPRAALIATFGRSLPEALLEFAAAAGLSDPQAAAEAMLDTYRCHNDEHHDVLIRPFPGVEQLLTVLHAAGLRLGVVTSKREGAARRGLSHYRLDRFFDVAVFHDDTIRHKPDPEPLVVASSKAGLTPADVVYVGDSVHDIAAGRAAGMRTIASLWGPFPRADLEAAGPDALAETPPDVLTLLEIQIPSSR